MTPELIAARFEGLAPADRRTAYAKLLNKMDEVAGEGDRATMLDYAAGAAAAVGMVLKRTPPDLTDDLIEGGMEEERARLPFVLLALDQDGDTAACPLASERAALDAVRVFLAEAAGGEGHA